MPDVPAYEQHFTRKVLLVCAILGLTIVVGLMFSLFLRVTLLLLAAVLLSVFFSRTAKLLSHYTRLPYIASYFIVLALIAGALGGTIYFVGDAIVGYTQQVVERFSMTKEELLAEAERRPWAKWLMQFMPRPKDAIGGNQVMPVVTSIFSFTSNALVGAVIVVVMAVYFGVDPDRYTHGLAKLLPISRRERFVEVMDKLDDVLWRWMLGRIVGMVVIGVFSTLGLWIIGIPLAVPLGVLAGLLTFIPNIGPTLALIPPVLFGLQQSPTTALYAAAWYLGLQLIETNLLEPLIDQRQVSLPPGVTIPAQLLVGMAAGLFGVAMATPLAAVILILVREYYVNDWLGDTKPGNLDALEPSEVKRSQVGAAGDPDHGDDSQVRKGAVGAAK
jgi:predicted PurR-regulated permease PerM